ncbi:Hypothetical predicted protein [Mytilus galloprovincialis]|uniref:DUF3504 domain-containing protein n=1 Tax=Mytilus galloprovincialis TaxID=29158 RepID=A0A8B6G0T6_MYTGA|nr:Hypothetical predicted protein [Mytilus galloprovincialis]
MAELNRADDIVPNVNEVDETAEFIEAMKNKNTKRKTASDVNIFTNWLSANNEHRKMEEIPVYELDKLLALFFMKVTKLDGTPYEPGTVKAFQSSISRYMTDKLNISIIRDKEFNHSREVLSAKMKELKTMRLGNPRCPVATYLEYAKRRPEDMMEADGPFYLGINRDIKDGVWNRKQAMGKNTLSDFVKTMCEEAKGQQEMSHILSNVGSGGISKQLKQKKGTDQNNNIDDMPSDDDDQLLSASQEAELGLVLKDITNYESNDVKKPNEIPEKVHENYKERQFRCFLGLI